MDLLSVAVRHERRLRLFFDAPLALAAFNSSALFRVHSALAELRVAGLILVAAQPHALELALGDALVEGVPYTVEAMGVPAANGTVSPPTSRAIVRLGVALGPSRTSEADDELALLYGVDLAWENDDFAEDAAGDLATLGGFENVRLAVARRCESDGLAWDPSYGVKGRRYVDGSPGALPTLKGALVRQARADDRVRQARATLVVVDDEAHFDLELALLGGESATVKAS